MMVVAVILACLFLVALESGGFLPDWMATDPVGRGIRLPRL
jgi:hypothetical protein